MSFFSAEGGPIWIKFWRLVQNDMSTAVMWSKSKPDVKFQYGGRLGEINGMSSQSHVSHCRVLAATWWIHCHDSRVTCHIAECSHLAKSMSWSCHIAGCKNSTRHIANRFSPYFILFLFLMQFRWRVAAFVSSPIHMLWNATMKSYALYQTMTFTTTLSVTFEGHFGDVLTVVTLCAQLTWRDLLAIAKFLVLTQRNKQTNPATILATIYVVVHTRRHISRITYWFVTMLPHIHTHRQTRWKQHYISLSRLVAKLFDKYIHTDYFTRQTRQPTQRDNYASLMWPTEGKRLDLW